MPKRDLESRVGHQVDFTLEHAPRFLNPQASAIVLIRSTESADPTIENV